MPIGKSVIVMGGDVKAIQLTEFLIKRDRKVTLVCEEDDMKFGEGLARLNNFKLTKWFVENGVEVIKNAKFKEITKTGLVFTTKEGEERTVEADSILPIYPLKKNESLYEAIKDKAPEVVMVGACKNPNSLIVDVVEDSCEVALSI